VAPAAEVNVAYSNDIDSFFYILWHTSQLQCKIHNWSSQKGQKSLRYVNVPMQGCTAHVFEHVHMINVKKNVEWTRRKLWKLVSAIE